MIDTPEFNAAYEELVARISVKPVRGLKFSEQYRDLHQKLADKYGSDFDARTTSAGMPMLVAEKLCIEEWNRELVKLIKQNQNSGSGPAHIVDIVGTDELYYGATGGGLTYQYTPTSLGTILTVKETISGKELNVSDALGWFFYG